MMLKPQIMQVQHQQSGKNGSFFIKENDDVLGEMEYKMKGENQMVITHTEVNDAYQGKGVGKLLVERGMEHARTAGYKVIPACTYAKAIIQRNDWMMELL
jgi:predicted GNAT family acetyltransferase